MADNPEEEKKDPNCIAPGSYIAPQHVYIIKSNSEGSHLIVASHYGAHCIAKISKQMEPIAKLCANNTNTLYEGIQKFNVGALLGDQKTYDFFETAESSKPKDDPNANKVNEAAMAAKTCGDFSMAETLIEEFLKPAIPPLKTQSPTQTQPVSSVERTPLPTIPTGKPNPATSKGPRQK